MRQKATWIIPGILATLLLGLLWAMPASAATGTIQFLDEEGGSAITHVSPNGPAGVEAGAGFWLQITDSDLNKPVKKTIQIRLTPEEDFGKLADNDEDWSNLADANGDGKLTYEDFTAFVDIPGPSADFYTAELDRDNESYRPVSAGDLNINVASGSLEVNDDDENPDNGVAIIKVDVDGDGVPETPATHLEYMIYEVGRIGSRLGADQTATYELASVDVYNVREHVLQLPTAGNFDPQATAQPPSLEDIDLSDRDPDMSGVQPGWATVLESRIPNIMIEMNLAEVEEAVAPLFKAWNTDRHSSEGDLDIHVSAGPPGLERLVTVAIRSVPAVGEPGDESYVPEVLIGLTNHDGDGTPDDLERSNVTVQFGYHGSEDVVWPGGVDVDYDELNRVLVSSDKGSISVVLNETAANSGVFGTTIKIESCDDPSCPASQARDEMGGFAGLVTLPVNARGGNVTVTYKDDSPSRDRTVSIPLDVDPPYFSGASPANGSAGAEDEPDLGINVVDSGSGILSDDDDARYDASIEFYAALFNPSDDSVIAGPLSVARDDLDDDDAIPNGFAVAYAFDEGVGPGELDNDGEKEYEIHWWVVAKDKAGNTGISDSYVTSDSKCMSEEVAFDSLTDEALYASLTANDCNPHKVRVDTVAPDMTGAVTGARLDGDEIKEGADGARTSVQVTFNEDLDCDSVSPGDFEVDDEVPSAVTCKDEHVYLTVSELDANAKPEVELVGAVSDRAGNSLDDDEVDAQDGIVAKLDVTVTGDAAGTRPVVDADGKITIAITSDEMLTTEPTVTIAMVGTGYDLVNSMPLPVIPTGATQWEAQTSSALDAGVWNVYVVGVDRESSQNLELETTAGMEDFGDDVNALPSDAILFEVDTGVPTPGFTPDGTEGIDNPNVFIRINFANEGKEYGLEADEDDMNTDADERVFTTDPDDVSADFDSHGAVSLMSAKFDGVDVTEMVTTRDNVEFIYRPGNLILGNHKLEIVVTDNAGNGEDDTHTLEFAVIGRQAFTLAINPGANLVSFPGDPADGDINAVFGGEADIAAVVTYDNVDSLWMSAARGADGTFMGSLATIDAHHAYWVISHSVLDLEVQLAQSGDLTFFLLFTQVVKGWNLVPVADTQQSAAGTRFSAKAYFANVDAEVACGVVNGRLQRIYLVDITGELDDPVNDNRVVKSGSGYWVYVNEDGVIIP